MRALISLLAAAAATSFAQGQASSQILMFDFSAITTAKDFPDISTDFGPIVTSGAWEAAPGSSAAIIGSSFYLNLTPLPGSITFSFNLAENFVLDIDAIQFVHRVDSISADWELSFNGGQWTEGGSVSSTPATVSLQNGFFEPSGPLISGIAGTGNTFTFNITPDEFPITYWDMDNFALFGSISVVPETGTLMMGMFGVLGTAFVGLRKRRVKSEQVA